MVQTVIYRHPCPECPLCERTSKRHKDDLLDYKCNSVWVHSSSSELHSWVLRCEEEHKKCPGYKKHKLMIKRFKQILSKHSIKSSSGRFLPIDQIEKGLLNAKHIISCLEHYGFDKVRKVKKKMKRKSEEWYVRKTA